MPDPSLALAAGCPSTDPARPHWIRIGQHGPVTWHRGHMSSSRTSTGVLLAIGAAVLFAVNGNVSKVALLNGISSLELVSMRSAGTAVILLVITRSEEHTSELQSLRHL